MPKRNAVVATEYPVWNSQITVKPVLRGQTREAQQVAA